MAKRRFQKGCFKLSNGKAYSFYYEDDQRPDGTLGSRKVRHLIGRVEPGGMSERAARREHDRIMQEVNRKRGSAAPARRGKTFQDAVTAWRAAVAPHLSPATIRQRESYLRQHILPRFADAAPHSLDVAALQQFATDLRKTLARKTVINILGAVFAILDYAERCGTLVSKVRFDDIELGKSTSEPHRPFLTREQATQIIRESPEPFKTLFAVAWVTALRSGELLALKTDDLDFDRKTVRVDESADDYTRELRQPKTHYSAATVPMPSALEAMLRNYLARHWKPNPAGYLFPNPKGTRPRLRDNVVRCHLKPILRKLGIPTRGVGLHSFRHGMASDLADHREPMPVLRQQMRHGDERTTLAIYAHVIPDSQREAMERLANRSIGTLVGNSTEANT